MNTVNGIITDIEGTTTSISFVHDTLFPYAARHLPDYVRTHIDRDEVRRALDELKQAGNVPSDDAAIEVALRFIEEDRKVGALKTLQGLIWEDGYRSGAYVAHVFPDVAPALRSFRAAGITCHVYSSGSVHAQKLLFGHTSEGDLTSLYDGYFDTSTGPKREAHSYQRIAEGIGIPPENLLFLSDSTAELNAASGAGLEVLGFDRPGNPPRPPSPHRFVTSFADIALPDPTATP